MRSEWGRTVKYEYLTVTIEPTPRGFRADYKPEGYSEALSGRQPEDIGNTLGELGWEMFHVQNIARMSTDYTNMGPIVGRMATPRREPDGYMMWFKRAKATD